MATPLNLRVGMRSPPSQPAQERYKPLTVAPKGGVSVRMRPDAVTGQALKDGLALNQARAHGLATLRTSSATLFTEGTFMLGNLLSLPASENLSIPFAKVSIFVRQLLEP
jgi:hypothetical protein